MSELSLNSTSAQSNEQECKYVSSAPAATMKLSDFETRGTAARAVENGCYVRAFGCMHHVATLREY